MIKASWTKEKVFHEGDEYYSHLCDAISSAHTQVDLETYIFEKDELGRKILAHLAIAAENGVKVRLLLDGAGCASWTYGDLKMIQNRGIAAQFYNPLPWQEKKTRLLSFFSLRKLNHRNHRKTCVIDGKQAFLGGMNISGKHSRSVSGALTWRDTSVQVSGKGVNLLSEAFSLAWAAKKGPRHSSLPQIRLNITHQQRRENHRDLLHRIRSAKKQVTLVTPYFVPVFSLLRALWHASRKGVPVQLLLPKKNDIEGMRWAAHSFYSLLLLSGVQIFEYTPSVLHAKISLIDRWVMIGSSNLNSRSLLHDLEADVVLSKPFSIRAVADQIQRDLQHSTEIKLKRWNHRPFIQRLFERFSLIIRNWI